MGVAKGFSGKIFYSAESLGQSRTSYIEVTTQEWSMTAFTVGKPLDREAFDRLLGELRPKLHRYCARMTARSLTARMWSMRRSSKRWRHYPSRDRSRVQRPGCFASLTMRHWIFCGTAPDRTPPTRTKTRT